MIIKAKILAWAGAGVSIAFLGLLSLMLWYRADAIEATAAKEKAERELELTVEVNKSNERAIELLEAWKKRSDEIYLKLATDIQALAAETRVTNEAIEKLGETNETVRDYLRLPIPDELRCLLNRTHKGGCKKGAGLRDPAKDRAMRPKRK